MEEHTFVVIVGGKRKEVTFDFDKDENVDDYDVQVKRRKKLNTLYLVKKDLERQEIASDVMSVALSASSKIVYIQNNDLFLHNSTEDKRIAINVTQIGYMGDTLVFLKNGLLYIYNDDNECVEIVHNSIKDVVFFACGPDAVVFITKDKILYGYGNGDRGKLGDYMDGKHILFVPTVIAYNVKHCSVSDYHTVFVTYDNALYGLGNSNLGGLGDFLSIRKNTNGHVFGPILITVTKVKKAIACLTSTIYIDNVTDKLCGTGLSKHRSLTFKRGSRVLCFNINLYTQAKVLDVKGHMFSILIKTTDGLYLRGKNNYVADTDSNCWTLINKKDEKVGDFDINKTSIVYIVE